MESAVDSSFFWGYLVTQVPGGFLASVYPANRIFGTAIACSAFLNLFLPGAFEFPGVIIIIRVMQGLVEVISNSLKLCYSLSFIWLKSNHKTLSVHSSVNHKTISFRLFRDPLWFIKSDISYVFISEFRSFVRFKPNGLSSTNNKSLRAFGKKWFVMHWFESDFLQGVTYPACHGIWRFWAPPLERSRLATMAFSGSYAGIVIGMPMSGILTSWISWKAAFYFYGVMGLVWYCFWLWLSFEKPRYHPAISIQELKYIEKSLGDSVKLQMPTISTTPWHEITRSMPVYAIIVANFCRSWNFYLLVLYQSKYLKHSFNYEIAEVSEGN